MSEHFHSVIANDVRYTINDVNDMTKEEAELIYGIEFKEDGKIFDPVYNQTFEGLSDWATFNIEQDDMEYEEHFHVSRDHEE